MTTVNIVEKTGCCVTAPVCPPGARLTGPGTRCAAGTPRSPRSRRCRDLPTNMPHFQCCVIMSFYQPFLLDDNILLLRLLLLLGKIYVLGKIFLQNFDDSVSLSGVLLFVLSKLNEKPGLRPAATDRAGWAECCLLRGGELTQSTIISTTTSTIETQIIGTEKLELVNWEKGPTLSTVSHCPP